jgi:polysaccharide biosynthesis/export protein
MKHKTINVLTRSEIRHHYLRARWNGIAALMLVLASLCGCSTSNPVETKVISDRPAPSEPGPYQIGSDDVIDVMVWKQPQLTSRLRVGSDGYITMPLIGQVHAAGLTTKQLQAKLTGEFSSYVHEPEVTVRIYNPASRVFYVIGEVSKPGVYPLMSGEVLSQALAAAGGPTEYANLRKVKIMRRESDQAVQMTVNFSAIAKGELAADVPLRRADTIVVP